MSRNLSTLFTLLVCASLCLSFSNAQADHCYGLVLQGGSDKGAYHAGAIYGLVSKLKAEAAQYDVVTGISIGAVNAGFISQYEKGQEKQMAQDLVDFWLNLSSSDFYKQWLGGILEGLLYKPSIYNNAPSQDFLEKTYKKIPRRYISVGATNIDDATYKAFQNFRQDLSQKDLVEAVMASFAVPGVFPYMTVNDSTYTDGGATTSMDVGAAIAKCRELTGGVDENIHIDVILLTGTKYKPTNASKFTSMQMLMRAIELMSYQSSISGLVQARHSYPNVDFRYLVQPQKSLPDSTLPLGFNHNDIKKMINLGTNDAITVLKYGMGTSFDEAVEEAKKLYFKGHEQKGEELLEKYWSEVEKLLKNNSKPDLIEL